MNGVGIYDGDLLLVDRSLDATNGEIIIAAVHGDLTVKCLIEKSKKKYLAPENQKYRPIEIAEEQDIVVWGIVTNVIHKV